MLFGNILENNIHKRRQVLAINAWIYETGMCTIPKIRLTGIARVSKLLAIY